MCRTKVIVIRFGKVGDLLVSYPTMLTIHRRIPDVEITLCVDDNYRQAGQVFSGIVSRVVCLDLQNLVPASLAKLPVLSEHYDLLIDLQAETKSCELSKLIKARRKIGFDTENTDSSSYTETVTPPPGEPMADSYYSLFRKGLASLPSEYDKIRLKSGSGSLNTIAIAPWGSAACKRWSTRKWKLLVNLIRREYNKCRVLLISQQKEEMLSGIHHDEWINQCTLSEVQAHLREVDLLISNESGLMHLGAITGCQVIALFGLGNVPIWSSYSDCILPIQNAYHCTKYEKENCELLCLRPDCLETIDPEQVMESVRSSFPDCAHA
jgi:ADP-heptose:LPS heptosyltransferase